ncbi:MAG: hypothetical protein H7Y38_03090 [Armatimonadetes bacterium]|nr:hypothetical protein [Armatimonadota bacterium]
MSRLSATARRDAARIVSLQYIGDRGLFQGEAKAWRVRGTIVKKQNT